VIDCRSDPSLAQKVTTIAQNATVLGCLFAPVEGGGNNTASSRVTILVPQDSSSINVVFNNCTFEYNRASRGGAVLIVKSSNETRSNPNSSASSSSSTSSISFEFCEFNHNVATNVTSTIQDGGIGGGAVMVDGISTSHLELSLNFVNTTFYNNSATTEAGTSQS